MNVLTLPNPKKMTDEELKKAMNQESKKYSIKFQDWKLAVAKEYGSRIRR